MRNPQQQQYSRPRLVWNERTQRRELQYEGLEGLKIRSEAEIKKERIQAERRADRF